MSAEKLASEKESNTERLARFGRNVNALGVVDLGGLAVLIPGPNAIFGGWAALNVIQAGGFEAWRESAAGKRRSRKDPNTKS